MQDFGGQYGGGGAPSGPGGVTHGSRTGRKERAGHVKNSEKCPRSRRSTCESLGRERAQGLWRAERLGRVWQDCGRRRCGIVRGFGVHVGHVGVLFREQREAPGGPRAGPRLLSRTFHTHLSGPVRRRSFRWAEGDVRRWVRALRQPCHEENGRGCVIRWGGRGGLRGAET